MIRNYLAPQLEANDIQAVILSRYCSLASKGCYVFRRKRREILSTIEGNQEESNGFEIDNSGFYSNVDTNDETLENNLTKKFDVKVEPEILTNKVESSKLSSLEKVKIRHFARAFSQIYYLSTETNSPYHIFNLEEKNLF